FQAEDGIRDDLVTGVQTCALPIYQVLPGAYSLSADGRVATFTPAAPLVPNAAHYVTVGTEVRDVAGNPLLEGAAWSFTTTTQAEIGRASCRERGWEEGVGRAGRKV